MPWPFNRGRGGASAALTTSRGAAAHLDHPDAAPPSSAVTATLDATEPADAAAWSDAETHVRVDRVHGFLCKVSVHARVDLPPAGVFAILTQPDNSGVFRAIEAMPYRRVISEEGGGGPGACHRRTVEVEHVARWRAGPLLTGTLSTRLVVDEDPGAGTVSFRLAPGGGGFMQAFEGAWHVGPFNQAELDHVLADKGGRGAAAASSSGGAWAAAAAAFARARGTTPALPSTGASLVTLTQAVGPRVPLPPPLDRLVAAICARQVKGLLQDLRAEAGRRRHRAAGQWRDGWAGGGGQPPPPGLDATPAPPVRSTRRLLW